MAARGGVRSSDRPLQAGSTKPWGPKSQKVSVNWQADCQWSLQPRNKSYSNTLTFHCTRHSLFFPFSSTQLWPVKAPCMPPCWSENSKNVSVLTSHSCFNPPAPPPKTQTLLPIPPHYPSIAHPSILRRALITNPSLQSKCPALVSCCCQAPP